jgi:hypothetical protein
MERKSNYGWSNASNDRGASSPDSGGCVRVGVVIGDWRCGDGVGKAFDGLAFGGDRCGWFGRVCKSDRGRDRVCVWHPVSGFAAGARCAPGLAGGGYRDGRGRRVCGRDRSRRRVCVWHPVSGFAAGARCAPGLAGGGDRDGRGRRVCGRDRSRRRVCVWHPVSGFAAGARCAPGLAGGGDRDGRGRRLSGGDRRGGACITTAPAFMARRTPPGCA